MDIPFVKEAMEMLDQFSPYWRSPNSNDKILCYPTCLDVLENRVRTINEQFSNNVAGQKGEDVVLALFQRLNMPGILVAGFQSKNLFLKLKPKRTTDFPPWGALLKLYNDLEKQFLSSSFECDFLFFHHKLGLHVVEVKSKKTIESLTDKAFLKAKLQLNRILKSDYFIRLSEILTNEKKTERSCFPIQGIMFFPFAKLSNSSIKHDDYLILDQHYSDQNVFNSFWNDRENSSAQIEFQYISCHTLIATVVGYRSAVHISECQNVLELHRSLSQQDFEKRERRNSAKNFEGKRIFLTPEQLSILECQSQFQIMFGPPGTGKTVLLLLKALETVKTIGNEDGYCQEVTNRVVKVVTYNGGYPGRDHPLVRKFERFFETNAGDLLMKPVVSGSKAFFADEDDFVICMGKKIRIVPDAEDGMELDTVGEVPLDSDDYFCDECNLAALKHICRCRQNATGQTVVVVTGNAFGSNEHEFDKITNIVNQEAPVDYKLFHMSKCLRGTGRIIEFWKRYLPHFEGSLTVGHAITGPLVEERDVLVTEMVNEVFKTVQTLLTSYKPFQPRDIAIICTECNAQKDIIKRMNANGIITTTDLLTEENSVFIEGPAKTISFEWPVVVAVFLPDPDPRKDDLHYDFTANVKAEGASWPNLYDRDMAIAMSRAMVKLIVLKGALPSQNWIDGTVDLLREASVYGQHTDGTDLFDAAWKQNELPELL